MHTQAELRKSGKWTRVHRCEICKARYFAPPARKGEPALLLRRVSSVGQCMGQSLQRMPALLGSTWPQLLISCWKWHVLASGLAQACVGGMRGARAGPPAAAAAGGGSALVPQIKALLTVSATLCNAFGVSLTHLLILQGSAAALALGAAQAASASLQGTASGLLAGLVRGYSAGLRHPLQLAARLLSCTGGAAVRLPGRALRLLGGLLRHGRSVVCQGAART